MPIERRRITPGPAGRALWLEWRKADVTASDLSALAGRNPYKTALDLHLEKIGVKPPPAETNLMRRGRWGEAMILAALREEHPELTVEPAAVYLRDTELRLGATPDFVAEDLADDEPHIINIQGKIVARPTFERDWADDTVPLGYQLQTLAEGMLMDARTNMVAALVLDAYSANLVLREVPRHPRAEAAIQDMARRFWENIAEGRQPAVDYARDEDSIKLLYPHAEEGTELDLSADNRLAALLPERAALMEAMKATEERLKAIKTEIEDKLGTAERGVLPGWKLTWKDETRAGYSVAPWSGRVLRVHKAKEDA